MKRKKGNIETDKKRRKVNRIAFIFLLLVFTIGIPQTIRINRLFETDSSIVSATILLPFRQRFIYSTIGTTPAFKCMYNYNGLDYTTIIDRNVTEEEYRSLYIGDTVVLKILKSRPERARWDKTYGIRHYVTP